MTERAVADPWSVLEDDPLADAWGLEPGFQMGHATMQQTSAERDLLYLDKAWSDLQSFTGPALNEAARPAFRMFEGKVRMHDCGWEAWIRVLTPDEIPDIARDLEDLSPDADLDEYALHYLHKAREFVSQLASEGRGMVYMIG